MLQKNVNSIVVTRPDYGAVDRKIRKEDLTKTNPATKAGCIRTAEIRLDALAATPAFSCNKNRCKS